MTKQPTSASKIRIMLIGSMQPPTGGISVILKYQAEELQSRPDVELVVVDVSSAMTTVINRIWVFFRSIIQIILGLHRIDVIVLNVRVPYDLYYGLILLPFLKATNKKMIVRKFAGNFDVRYNQVPSILRMLYDKVLFKSVSLWLFERKALVEAFSDKISNIVWYPNHRKMEQLEEFLRISKPFCRNFIYVGHVREGKGMRELINASERLPEGIKVDVYGPLFADIEKNIFQNCKNIHYQGVLNPEQVIPTMTKYDAFVFPTKFQTEGHPGVILESYAAGLPVIATKCGAIPEIMDESVGFLIEPNNEDALFTAMTEMVIDVSRYQIFRGNIREKAKHFSTDYWTTQFIMLCKQAINA